jgi:hypothetical protein
VRKARSRSFTLVEVAVALALGVLLAAATQVLVVRAYRASQLLEKEDMQAAALRLPFELLRGDLLAQPSAGGIELRDGVLTFLTLCDLEGGSHATRHTVEVRYRAESAGESLVLRRAQRTIGNDAKWLSGIVAAKGLKAVSLAVFDGQRWETTWPPSVGRPARGVRVILTGRSSESTETIPLGPCAWRRHDE